MANHKSAIKRNRQNIKRNARNTGYRTQVKNLTKKVLAVVEEKDQAKAGTAMKAVARTLSRVGSSSVLHKRAASRKISGLAKKVHQLSVAG